MKNVLRWIALLPGAVLAMILVNSFNSIALGYILPDFIPFDFTNDLFKSWFGSIAFIAAARYIAPKGKVVTSIVVASAYCSVGTFAVIVAIHTGRLNHPAWEELLMAAVSVLACVNACALIHYFEKENQAKSLAESQKN